MKRYYSVTFKWYDSDLYCTNIVYTDTEDNIKEKYSKYGECFVSKCSEDEVELAKRKGMPIVEL